MKTLADLIEDLRRGLRKLWSMNPRLNKIYDAAYKHIGGDASPNDIAPDELGCAETVWNIILNAGIRLGTQSGPIVSTAALEAALRTSPNFVRVYDTPVAGDIIISPTGTSHRYPSAHGHTGIIGHNKGPDGSVWIMSNDSRTGTFEANYTLDGWERYYVLKRDFPVLVYRLAK